TTNTRSPGAACEIGCVTSSASRLALGTTLDELVGRAVAHTVGEPSLDLRDNHLDRDRVVAAPRHDHVRVALAGLDELQVHGAHRGEVLLEDLVDGAAALRDVAAQ